jgi:hypothetical protein
MPARRLLDQRRTSRQAVQATIPRCANRRPPWISSGPRPAMRSSTLCRRSTGEDMRTKGMARPTLHAVYPDVVYELGLLGWHFVAVRDAWEHALVLASLRSGEEEGSEARVTKIFSCSKSPLFTLTPGTGSCGLRSSYAQKVRRHYPTR